MRTNNSRLARWEKIRVAACALALAGMLGCETTPVRKSDAELGLNPQQARGRQIYDMHCLVCHEAYSSGGVRGPSMQKLYRKPYMPSGTPVNDERVAEVTVRGRSKMPGFGAVLTDQQVEDLLAYMKTL